MVSEEESGGDHIVGEQGRRVFHASEEESGEDKREKCREFFSLVDSVVDRRMEIESVFLKGMMVAHLVAERSVAEEILACWNNRRLGLD